MNRITKRSYSGYITDCANCPKRGKCNDSTDCVEVVLDRLAAYEDTGLAPEEITRLCDMDRRAKMAEILRAEDTLEASIDRIRELAQAEKEGRCMLLPCKVGDTLYIIAPCENVCMMIDDDYETGTGATECPFEDSCDIEECDDNHIRIFETKCSGFMFDKNGQMFTFFENLRLEDGYNCWGKTAFLNREAAEAALSGKEKNENLN